MDLADGTCRRPLSGRTGPDHCVRPAVHRATARRLAEPDYANGYSLSALPSVNRIGTVVSEPMSEKKYRPNCQRLDDQIADRVVDAIMVAPRSSGRLSLPGTYSVDSRPPAHRIVVTGTGPGPRYEQIQLGSAEHYRVIYEVQNPRDSVVFANLELTDE